MSMINDALRRASGATATEPFATPGEVPPPLPSAALGVTMDLPPLVDSPPPKKSALPLLLGALFLFCLAGAAGVYLWERSHRASPSKAVPQKSDTRPVVLAKSSSPSDSAAVPASAAPASTPATVKPASPAVAAVATPIVAKSAPAQPVAATVTAPAQSTVAAGNVTFPPLRLQGIYFRPPNPSVMINGRTLYVNDQVQGVTVASIDQSSVTLVLSGRTNVLTLR